MKPDCKPVSLCVGQKDCSLFIFYKFTVAGDGARPMFLILDHPHDRDSHPVLGQNILRRVYWRGRAVYDYQAWQWPLIVAKAAREYLFERAGVVARLGTLYLKFAVLALFCRAALHDRHHPHRRTPTQMRDIVGFNSIRAACRERSRTVFFFNK